MFSTRKKAILEKDENYSDPVCVYFKHTDDLDYLCAEASFYICKYANALIFEDFDENIPIAANVLGPAIPSTVKPFFDWNNLTAATVLLPYIPSILPL